MFIYKVYIMSYTLTYMNKDLIQTLQDIGLSEKEALVYLAGIQLGPTSILKISQATDIKRPTVYTIFNELIRKGLAYIAHDDIKKKYICHSPQKLSAVIAEKQSQLENHIPDFLSLYKQQSESHLIEEYVGLETIKHLYMNLLTSLKRNAIYYVIGSQEEWYFSDERFWQKFIEKRAKIELDVRLLLQDSHITRFHKQYEKNYTEKIRVLPDHVTLDSNIVITPHAMIIHELAAPMRALVIKSPSIIASHIQLFELLWGEAK